MNNMLILDGIFCSGMVLQRDRINRLWGSCPAGAQISASLDGQNCTVVCVDEAFTVRIPAREASSGHIIEITCGAETIVLEDVCFGDVYLLSGQSNMQLEVNRVMDISGDEVLAADFPLVRQFTVEPRYMFGAQAQDIVPRQWIKGVYPEVMGMSAAGFFFARRLHSELNIPVGLVLNAMGGSTIEAWMPEELLEQFGDYSSQIREFYDHDIFENKISGDEQAAMKWVAGLSVGDESSAAAAVPAEVDTYYIPSMTFDTALEGYCGSVWFYREVELDSVPDKDGLLYLGDIVDSDRTYVNGQLVGETGYRYPPRKYRLPTGLLKKGKNLIACRMVINGETGGFVPYHPYYLDTGFERIDLTGEWYMKRESRAEEYMTPALFPPVLPTGLYNASLYPIRNVEFSGVLWYQGESNVEAPDRYNEKFDAMITEWRKLTGQKLPVVCVELCDYIDPTSRDTEVPADWREMQRMQREQPRFTADCAVVCAADLGERLELHPQRKQELGERLAQEVLRLIYSRK